MIPVANAATLVDAALRGAVIALLLLAAGVALRERPHERSIRVFAVFAFGLIVQTVGSQPLFEATVPRVWQAPLVGIAVGNAVLFWVFVQSLFDDDFALGPWHVIAWLAVAGVSAANCTAGFAGVSVPGRIGIAIQRGAPLLFALLAAVAAATTWRVDLVEGRRRVRSFVVVAGIVYTLALLATRLASPNGRLVAWTAALDTAGLLSIVGLVSFATFRIGPSAWLPPARSPASPGAQFAGTPIDDDPHRGDPTDDPADAAADVEDERRIDALQRLMRDERAYRSDGLTIGRLAARLSLPEYRLRRLINRRLGHRNFNAFVNSYRLDDARDALRDPARRGLPVLTIALDAGFQSIGPFNRAFKAATGLTPSEFRRQNLAD